MLVSEQVKTSIKVLVEIWVMHVIPDQRDINLQSVLSYMKGGKESS